MTEPWLEKFDELFVSHEKYDKLLPSQAQNIEDFIRATRLEAYTEGVKDEKERIGEGLLDVLLEGDDKVKLFDRLVKLVKGDELLDGFAHPKNCRGCCKK